MRWHDGAIVFGATAFKAIAFGAITVGAYADKPPVGEASVALPSSDVSGEMRSAMPSYFSTVVAESQTSSRYTSVPGPFAEKFGAL
jgi:hypothetical protein